MNRSPYLLLACLLVAGCPGTTTVPDTSGTDAPALDAPRLDAGPVDAPVPMDTPTPMDVMALMDGLSPELDVPFSLPDAPDLDARMLDVPFREDVPFTFPDVPLRRDVGGLACGSGGGCSPGMVCCFRLGICVPSDCPDCCPIVP